MFFKKVSDTWVFRSFSPVVRIFFSLFMFRLANSTIHPFTKVSDINYSAFSSHFLLVQITSTNGSKSSRRRTDRIGYCHSDRIGGRLGISKSSGSRTIKENFVIESVVLKLTLLLMMMMRIKR